MAFVVEIKGLTELQAKLTELPKDFESEVNGMIQRGMEVGVRNAQNIVPVNFGWLKGSINFTPNPVTNLHAKMVASRRYAPYVEFGTITRVSIPPIPGLAEYALTFKGRGLRKNGGMFPRPFFFRQIPVIKQTIEKAFESLFKTVKI